MSHTEKKPTDVTAKTDGAAAAAQPKLGWSSSNHGVIFCVTLSLLSEGEALEQAIRAKIEYYFSIENLRTDSYLLSKMNTDLWVDITLLLQFRGLVALGADEKHVVEALKSSKTVAVNPTGTMVRPIIKVERKTLIIRDIPADAEEKVIISLPTMPHTFSPKQPLISLIAGGSWYIR